MEKITKSSDSILIDPNEPLILPDGTALVGRIEWFLYALCCLDYQNLPTPMSRIEEFANALITGEIPNIQPQSRAEQFFLAILDGNISDLPQPQSRSEVLLDKLARGEFDLSDVEPIQSRYELLLAYLIKNGGIGNIDYVLYEFSEAMKTMYNTVEKPFKSLELSGNTLVNCVLEDTENDDYTSFDKDYSGTSFTINGTSEGAIKSAILKGQTLVNICKPFEFDIQTTGSGLRHLKDNVNMLNIPLDDNKKYSVWVEIDINEIGAFSVSYTGGVASLVFDSITNLTLTGGSVVAYPCVKRKNSNNTNFTIGAMPGSTEGRLKGRIMVFEGDVRGLELSYFEGMQSVKMPVLKATGKNLLNGDWENGGLSLNDGVIIESNTTVRSKVFSKVVPATDYSVSMENYTSGQIFYYDKNYNFISRRQFGENNLRITTPNNAEYVKLQIKSTTTDIKVQFEEGLTVTPYEPYKSNILSCNEEVELRGIGDVKDELNLSTGEVVERIGEIVLDGNEDWIRQGVSQNNSNLGIYYSPKALPNTIFNTNNVLCDKFKTSKTMTWHSSEEDIYISISTYGLKICFDERKLESATVGGLKKWLSENTPTIQYPLVEKPVKTVDLNVVDQNNTKIDKIHVFNEVTHVNASSDGLTPTVNIDKSVSYPTIIKPNTKYTVDLKRNDKSLTVNLSGTEVTFASGETRKVITTPSTLTNDKLSYYGIGAKCNEIMLIEGEVERNVDYFTGMQSVVMQNQMPILTTVGKNLFDFANSGLREESAYDKSMSGYGFWSFGVQLQPNKEVTISRKNNDGYNLGLNLKIHNENTYNGGKWLIANHAQSENKSSTTLTTNSDGYIWFIFSNNFDKINQILDICEYIQIEYGTQATSYEPYKTSILSLPQEVVLRSLPNGVCDTLDTQTGIYTKRIGEISTDDVINNTTWIKADGLLTSNNIAFYYKENNIKTTSGGSEGLGVVVSDVLPYTNRDSLMQDIEGIATSNKNIIFKILKSKLPSSLSVDDFKRWLKANPITIQYELANPIIKTVDLNVVDQDGNTIPKIKSYKDVTHLEVTVPKQSLLPHISAEVATDNSKDMSSLTTKHQEISETQSAIQDNIQSQSDEINTALMATTEIFESILE